MHRLVGFVFLTPALLTQQTTETVMSGRPSKVGDKLHIVSTVELKRTTADALADVTTEEEVTTTLEFLTTVQGLENGYINDAKLEIVKCLEGRVLDRVESAPKERSCTGKAFEFRLTKSGLDVKCPTGSLFLPEHAPGALDATLDPTPLSRCLAGKTIKPKDQIEIPPDIAASALACYTQATPTYRPQVKKLTLVCSGDRKNGKVDCVVFEIEGEVVSDYPNGVQAVADCTLNFKGEMLVSKATCGIVQAKCSGKLDIEPRKGKSPRILGMGSKNWQYTADVQ